MPRRTSNKPDAASTPPKLSAGAVDAPVKPAGGEAAEFAEVRRPGDHGPAWQGPEQVLLQHGKITPADLAEAAKKRQANPHLSLLAVLVQSDVVSETTAQQSVAEYFKLPFAHVMAANVDSQVFGMLPPDYIRAKKVLPIRRVEKDVLVGIIDPADVFLIDDLKRRFKGRVQLIVVVETDVTKVIEALLAVPVQQAADVIRDVAEDSVEVVGRKAEEVADLAKIAGERPVVRYANFLISSAVRQGASDIHIEPGENRLRVRYRIDGLLFEQQAPPLPLHAAVVSRLKMMANLDVAERRLPQDGRIRATVRGRAVDLRVSTLPTIHGEKCVIRILDDRSILVGLENLGMSAEVLEKFRRQISQPRGILLVAGPAGSGRSTTLYSALRAMDSRRLNISTVEDPVECELDGINQVNVHDSVGLSFAAALRGLLRQDPDVMMVSEIRDEETARLAVQASLAGRLVLSTLHATDAPSGITRLIHIGVEPYLVSASVNAVVAQRLVRKICESCKAPVEAVRECDAAYLRKFQANVAALYRGTGCDKCRRTGYQGRIGIYELLELDDDLRELITSNPPLAELRRAARQSGMKSLRQDGLEKVASGVTTVDELMRATET